MHTGVPRVLTRVLVVSTAYTFHRLVLTHSFSKHMRSTGYTISLLGINCKRKASQTWKEILGYKKIEKYTKVITKE